MAKVYINTTPVADQYSAANEKIIEFSSPNGGGLISFRLLDGEHAGYHRLLVEVYRTDDTVRVTHAPDNFDPARDRCEDAQPTAVAAALAEVDRAAQELDRTRDAGEDDDAAESGHLDALITLADAVRAASS